MTASEPNALADTRATLEAASAGLLYTSEGDHPFDFFVLPGASAAWPLTAEQVRARLDRAEDEPAREITLDRFFQGHIENADPNDPAGQALVPRFQALKDALTDRLDDVRVFRIGQVEIDCYALGRTRSGEVAGLHTVAIET